MSSEVAGAGGEVCGGMAEDPLIVGETHKSSTWMWSEGTLTDCSSRKEDTLLSSPETGNRSVLDLKNFQV